MASFQQCDPIVTFKGLFKEWLNLLAHFFFFLKSNNDKTVITNDKKKKCYYQQIFPNIQIEEEQWPWGPRRHVSWPDSSTSWSWGTSLMSCTQFPPLWKGIQTPASQLYINSKSWPFLDDALLYEFLEQSSEFQDLNRSTVVIWKQVKPLSKTFLLSKVRYSILRAKTQSQLFASGVQSRAL